MRSEEEIRVAMKIAEKVMIKDEGNKMIEEIEKIANIKEIPMPEGYVLIIEKLRKI